MKRVRIVACLAFVCMMAAVNFTSADTIRGIDIDFVTIGNAGNAGHYSLNADPYGCGAVSYNYRIGKYEITNAQWNTFTAAAGAPTGNPTSAYDKSAVYTGAQQPTNMVSWYEAAQFSNYLTSGNKYSGAYQFDISGNFLSIDRVSSISTYGTTYVIPTEDEWYKAAYFKPDASGYSLYANGTNTGPIAGVNSNHKGVIGSPWDIITNGTQEQNGTYDMMGNVWEWNEALITGPYEPLRGRRGGSFDGWCPSNVNSSGRLDGPPWDEVYNRGFRVASVPEPATLFLLTLGGLFLRKRRK